MRNARRMIAAAVLGGMALASPAQAGLMEEKELNARLAVVATADMIRKGCGSIEARMVTATAFLWDTAYKAQAMGYSREEIEAYIDNDEAKARVEAGAEAYLKANGGMDEAALCATGKAEIAAGSAIGKLLK